MSFEVEVKEGNRQLMAMEVATTSSYLGCFKENMLESLNLAEILNRNASHLLCECEGRDCGSLFKRAKFKQKRSSNIATLCTHAYSVLGVDHRKRNTELA